MWKEASIGKKDEGNVLCEQKTLVNGLERLGEVEIFDLKYSTLEAIKWI